eukprot:756203-Rhodomonas_salina.1
MKVADALILEDEEFHQIMVHPIQDSFTTPTFKVAVINLVVNNSTDFFPDPNDNVNPAVGVKIARNDLYIQKVLLSIQSQLSDAVEPVPGPAAYVQRVVLLNT